MAGIRDELLTDPLGRGYVGMSDQAAADDLNTAYRTRNRTSMTGDELFQATVPSEFNALSTGSGNNPDNQGHWLSFCGRETIDPFATANEQFVIDLFGGGSGTVAALQAARVESITRGEELGIGIVKVGHVEEVRRI